MTDERAESAKAWADDEGIWLELRMNSGFAFKIPLDPAEADKLARELGYAFAEWKRYHP